MATFICMLVLLLNLLATCQPHVVAKKGALTVDNAVPINEDDAPKQTWDYVSVRKDAFMFWWLYYTTATEGYTNRPLILWLQGGPGGSSTGFGNFQELGPLDVNLKPRNTSWVSEASVLFIDNPVGTGYSYVTNPDAYATDNAAIVADLVTTMTAFLKKTPEFQTVPFYIFSESYGGKMAAGLAQGLQAAIQKGSVKCNLQGVAMGDSWISPVDSVMTWGPYLYATSVVAEQGLATINKSAMATKAAVDAGNFSEATELWSQTESVVGAMTFGVNFYNILKWGVPSQNKDTTLRYKPSHQDAKTTPIESLYTNHVVLMQNDALSDLMNGPIRKKLGIIPKDIVWGAQSSMVFSKLSGDFMKPVVDVVGSLLNTPIKVVVYSGQLDLIVDTMGTELWIPKTKWSGLPGYKNAARKPFNTASGKMAGFCKTYKNMSFYWVLNAGHMVPSDAGDAALAMLKMITTSS